MEENNKKRKISKRLSVILVIALIILVGGVTYAVWTYTFTGNENTIGTEDISIEFLESDSEIITINNALPETDTKGITEDPFEFVVTSKTKRDMSIAYTLSLEKLAPDTGYTSLNDSDIKVYLTDYNNNVLVAPTLISNLSNYKLYSKTNAHSTSAEVIQDKYKLRAWIDYNVDALNWDETTKLEYKFRINVNALEKESTTAAETLISKVGQSGLTKITHEADNTLQIGATEAIEEYRYVGPNSTVSCNYATFNNESYRIIGVFPTDDGTGKIENRIKLIKEESIDDMYWNEDGTNNWANATLKTYLNGTYYNSLSTTSKNLIGNAKYYLGGATESLFWGDCESDGCGTTKEEMYSYERKTNGSDYYYGSNPTNWTGKIGLMYASDYGYAVSSTCTHDMGYYDESGCYNNDWLYLGSNEWLLPQGASDSGRAVSVYSDGDVGSSYDGVGDYQFAVRPVLYLISAAQITGGDGTSGNPYTFGL